jgi:uncharacterized protein YkwD
VTAALAALLSGTIVPAAAHAAPADRATAVAIVAAQDQDDRVPSGWTGSTAGCNRGTEPQASLDATLRSINRFRAFAELPPVTLDPALNQKALAAALMMEAKDELEHFPGSDWPCYTAEGADGASHSNLFLSGSATSGPEAVEEYIKDIGHGKLVLNPLATVMGTGTTTRANALYVVTGGRAPVAGQYTVWPAPGWVPWGWMPDEWRVIAGGDDFGSGFELTGITVTVDGTRVTVTNAVSDDFFGGESGTMLLFTPALPSALTGGDHVVHVHVVGTSPRGARVDLTWTVCGFNRGVPGGALTICPKDDQHLASGAGSGTGTGTGTGGGTGTTTARPGFARAPLVRRVNRRGRKVPVGTRPRAGTRLAVAVTALHGRVAAYQWLRDGKAIRGATASTYKLRPRDRGHRISVRVTVRATGGSLTARRTSSAVKV